MVLVMELPNAFWGVTVNEGKRYTQKLTGAIHVSMAALEPGSNKDGPVSVMIQHDKADFMLCSLSSEKVFQQTLDLNFNEGEEVTFYLKGKGVVHLTGYVLTGDQFDSDSDDLDFEPGNSFALASDDSSSEDEEEDGGGDMPAVGSKKRKKQILDKKSKKAKVEIVDDDDDDDDEKSDTDDDDDDDDEEETPKKKKSDKVKPEQSKKHQPSPKSQSKQDKKDKHSQKAAAESTTATKEQSASKEPGEKKKRKRNKKKKSENSTTQASDGPSSNETKGPSKKPSSKVVEGVVMEDLKVGHGPEAKNGSTVHVYYTGRLANGKLFDSKNAGKPAKFRLGKKEIIKGWDVGLQGMKVGGRRKLVIPPHMGYGSQNVGGIPSNSTLQFEVELKAVN